MTALKPSDITSFLKSPPKTIDAVLIYGPDAGLVSERSLQLAKKFASLEDPAGEILILDDADLAANPDRLAVELQMISMFGGRNVIRLKAGSRTNPKQIEELISDGPLQSRLIIEAGDLKKNAKLRTIFEKSNAIYAIPCYADDNRALADLIREEMSNAGRTIDKDTANYLQSLLGADRTLSRNELQKLILYTEGQSSITTADIDAIIGDSAALALDTICYAVTGGKTKDALHHFDRATAAGHAPQSIAMAVNRHIMSMFHVRAGMESGETLDGAMRKLRPPIFYKRQSEFQSHCRRWTANLLIRALSQTKETLVRCRTTPDLERTYSERLILTLSKMGS